MIEGDQESGQVPPAVGQILPDLRLPDHNGAERSLSELIGGDPTILQTFRGPWCPKEQRFFRRLLELQDEMEVAYSRLISVSVDPPNVNRTLRTAIGARWVFLSDEPRSTQAQLGLREWTDTVHDPYLPAVFVLRPDRTVHSAYNGYWYWGRPTVEELILDLRTVSMEVRGDWDPPRRTPGRG